ncbi:hypothetical protein D3C72_2114300 [compost metagenome]
MGKIRLGIAFGRPPEPVVIASQEVDGIAAEVVGQHQRGNDDRLPVGGDARRKVDIPEGFGVDRIIMEEVRLDRRTVVQTRHQGDRL